MKKFTSLLIPLSIIISIVVLHPLTTEIDQKELITGNSQKEPLDHSQGNSDNPFAASQFRYEMISTTKETKEKFIDLPELRRKAIEHSERFLLPPETDNSASAWTALGPGNIGGRIRSIIIHPTTPTKILIGSVSGGIWKTTDGGSSWSAKIDDLDPISIGSMVMDPKHPDTVYAGTGEGWTNFDAVYGNGVYRSTNFGDTWTLLSSTTSSSFRNVLRMTADTLGNIYAATKSINTKQGGGEYTLAGGLYKTTNQGTSWTKISSSTFSTNYFNPTDVLAFDPSEILFAVNNNGGTLGGIYRTTDGGSSWAMITSGLPTADYRRIAFAQDPSHHDTVYAVFQSTDVSAAGDGGLKGIYRSTNRGVDWTALSTPPKISSTSSLSYLGTQGWYDNVIAVDPFSSSNLYTGGVDMMKSTNGGTNWSQLTYWHSFYGTPVVHADHHVIAFDPLTSGTVYSGNDGGIYKTTDGGANWSSLNIGLQITQFYSGAVSPTGSIFYGGTQDNGHLKFSSGTDWTMVEGGDGGYSAVDQTTTSTAYEEYVNLAISKSTNSGSTWFSATSGLTDAGSSAACLFIAPFAMNPDNSDVLIAGSDNVWITSDGAGSWTASSGTLSSGEKVSAVTVVKSSADYIGYAGTTDGKIFKCSALDPASGLDTWTEITPATSNGAWVRRIVVKPGSFSDLIACYSGYNISPITPLESKHVWKSTDGGSTWTDISGDLPNIPVHSAVFDPVDASTYYIGTETGVYKTTNSGTSWTLFSVSGIAKYVPVDELVYQTGTGTLFAFTHGRGAFKTDVPLPVELASFTSSVMERDVVLNWTTSSEINNSGFDIERRLVNNTDWIKTGSVAGNGTTNESQNYSFTDKDLSSGNYNYRLKQIDYNGNFNYHNLANEVTVGVPEKFYLSQNYPNPFNPATKIDFEIPFANHVSLKVYDMNGKEILNILNEDKDAGYYTIELNAENLSSGVYFYKLTASGNAGNFTNTKKMVIVK